MAPETNMAPFWECLFSGAMLVSGSVSSLEVFGRDMFILAPKNIAYQKFVPASNHQHCYRSILGWESFWRPYIVAKKRPEESDRWIWQGFEDSGAVKCIMFAGSGKKNSTNCATNAFYRYYVVVLYFADHPFPHVQALTWHGWLWGPPAESVANLVVPPQLWLVSQPTRPLTYPPPQK